MNNSFSVSYKGYRIQLSNRAKKSIQKFPPKDRLALLDKLDLLLSRTDSLDIKKLMAYDNLYRVRSGDYRIIYKLDTAKKTIIVLLVAHRKEVYKLLNMLAHLMD